MARHKTRFQDRKDAGRRLVPLLQHLSLDRPAVFALPRGGVPVAAEVARALEVPLDLILVRKIGAPGNDELALGALAEGRGGEAVVNDDIWRATRTTPEYFAKAKAAQEEELERRRERYLGDRPRIDPAGREMIVIDDGLATGATMKAALSAMRARGAARIVVGLPVAPADTLAALEALCDEVVCLQVPDRFYGVSAFYDDFHQLTDAETVAILDDPDLIPGAGS